MVLNRTGGVFSCNDTPTDPTLEVNGRDVLRIHFPPYLSCALTSDFSTGASEFTLAVTYHTRSTLTPLG